jgi:hypothetical protein
MRGVIERTRVIELAGWFFVLGGRLGDVAGFAGV